MRRIITAVLLGSLCVGVAQAQQASPPAQQPAPTIVTIDQAKGYNYGAVCLFADLVAGYTLPTLTPRFTTDPHFHLAHVYKTPSSSNKLEDWKYYSYTKAGVQGEVVQRPSQPPYFHQFRHNDTALPAGWRTRQDVIAAFYIDPKHSTGDPISLACETYTVNFHFEQDRLRYVEVQIGMID